MFLSPLNLIIRTAWFIWFMASTVEVVYCHVWIMSGELEVCVAISAFFLNWRNYRFPQIRCGTPSDQVGSIITDTFVHDFCYTNIIKCKLSSWSRVLFEKQMVGNQVHFSAFYGLWHCITMFTAACILYFCSPVWIISSPLYFISLM